ncbi:hypothetical protein POF51_25820 [Brevibacillus sp. AG]|uniref:hypothetical protein n=1 Tax=Brevibacillus sp. AG TaxID=3020891 RepID=UPI002330ABA5|nr:hypothetical protein [Brevibacillus sp. AG]MDC0764141.1 hypothetical protein [Brevibacillus sp. AG]
MNTLLTGNLLDKFAQISISNEDRLPEEDTQECKRLEQQFNETKAFMISYIEYVESHKIKNEWLNSSSLSKNMNEELESLKVKFIRKTVYYFEKKYEVSIDSENICNKYDLSVTYDDIITEIYTQMDGFSFKQVAVNQLKAKFQNNINWRSEIVVKNKKVHIPKYISWQDWSYGGKTKYSMSFDYRESLICLFSVLSHIECGEISVLNTFDSIAKTYNSYNFDQFERYELDHLNKVKSFKAFKNRKIEIEFATNDLAMKFVREYCGIMEGVA